MGFNSGFKGLIHSAILRHFESKRNVERNSKMSVVFTVSVSCSTDDSALNRYHIKLSVITRGYKL